MFDPKKARQAAQEAAYAFVVGFAVVFGTFLAGLSKVPNLEEGRAAIAAAIVAGLVAVGKALVWYATGTKVP